ncbi:DNA cytosine methyltransferase [Vibrio vulnificus]|uniref:DNA cytosine methyltransferase n=1 Tax=Vibrio vulnificus TaxID=672 RepID=UPI00102938EB|nr:DNA cytosine methyltransferase [Vibrio vulnificus]EHH1226310.1 DNA cytosine methyltransferase [Vibrio vulnificus]ELX4133044.1 DNA cytosine methyltransferase [Vibrio vulnificus]ELX4178093.1 DNA cytosine methyltransferase [Vibrio vulnificus]MDK2638746.1 DNA cytosine methyltransferase [Vibrio vulnificus]MDK2647103.1 DNA cytosine methyltransferase [Vibrio vulnificus]
MIGIDLFSGAGGMSHGAYAAGVDVQHVIEADKAAALTYLANHTPKYGLFNDDIRKFKPENQYDREHQGLVIFGGPPCQGFSTSNQKTRKSSNGNNWLFEEFVRLVAFHRSDWFVFENVKGILETEKGHFVEQIVDRFERLGYTLSLKLLNAADYGIPQKRSRFFIVGSLHGKCFTFPTPKLTKPVTVSEAISDLPLLKNGASNCFMPYSNDATSEYAKKMRIDNKDGCNNNLVTRNNNLIVERYKHIPQGGNWENIPDRLMQNYADKSRCHTGIYRRLVGDEPSVVIGNYRKNMLIHPLQDRGLSVREAARLQSFPDNFIFKGSIGFQQQQVGNAVPPLLAKEIFQEIKNQ